MRNKLLEAFDIHLLSIKEHAKEYEFQIDETFFKEFKQDLIEKGNLKVLATVTKTHSMVTVDFDISGKLEYVCDRSLEKYDEPFRLDTTLFFKYGENAEELDVNLYQIEENTITINLAKYLIECILVEIPLRKVHPKFQGEESEEDDETPFFQTETEETTKNDKIDPRWAELKKLKK